MNERIRKLYIQSIHDTKHNPADDINVQIAERFAELIVRECMSCCDVVEKVEWIEPTTYEFGVQACKVKIQTHFGVEE